MTMPQNTVAAATAAGAAQAASQRRYRSKTLAAWLALLGGTFGVHRLYLHGLRDVAAWLHPWPTLLGLAGLARAQNLGVDDRWSWVLLPVLGVMIVQACVCAIFYGLTPDERWDAQRNPGAAPRDTRWGPVLAVVGALMLGTAALVSTIAYGSQRFFEWQLEQAAASQPPAGNGAQAGMRPRSGG